MRFLLTGWFSFRMIENTFYCRFGESVTAVAVMTENEALKDHFFPLEILILSRAEKLKAAPEVMRMLPWCTARSRHVCSSTSVFLSVSVCSFLIALNALFLSLFFVLAR